MSNDVIYPYSLLWLRVRVRPLYYLMVHVFFFNLNVFVVKVIIFMCHYLQNCGNNLKNGFSANSYSTECFVK